MSGPPSPARRPSNSSTSEENTQDVTMLSVSGARLPTTIEEEEPDAAPTTSERPATGTTAASESTTPSNPPTTRALPPPDPRPPAEDVLPETLAGDNPTAIASRGGRRSKAHVANACVAATAGPMAGAVRAERPVAPMSRHHRGDSFRSIRSFESSPPSISSSSPSYARPASRSWPQPRATMPAQQYATPVAFLDLDLKILKTNSTFQQLFTGTQDLRGRRLNEIARPIETDGFTAMRNQLRAEREAKDPAYLPPIFPGEHDPLAAVNENDIDVVAHGFQDRQFLVTYSWPGGTEQTLATRVRLARTSIYFVVISLPPIPQQPTSIITSSAHVRHPSSSSITTSPAVSTFGYRSQLESPQIGASRHRGSISMSEPQSPFHHHSGWGQLPSVQADTQRGSSTSTHFQTSLPSHPYPSATSMATMQPTAAPTADVRSGDIFTPRFAPRRLSQPWTFPEQQHHQQTQRQPTQPQYQSSFHGYQGGPSNMYPASLSSRPSTATSSGLPVMPSPSQFPQASSSSTRPSSSHHPPPPPPSALLPSQRPNPYEQQMHGRPRRDTLGRQMSSDPEEEENDPTNPNQRSPRKRRRLDIGDVLQK
ncbi:hypothetical protein MBLNU457_5439t1 [Dothideomycetes sp. NU457]